MAVQRKSLLTAQFHALDECGDDWLIFRYTQFERETREGLPCTTWAQQAVLLFRKGTVYKG
jgi:hypothetical protein